MIDLKLIKQKSDKQQSKTKNKDYFYKSSIKSINSRQIKGGCIHKLSRTIIKEECFIISSDDNKDTRVDFVQLHDNKIDD